MGSDIYKPSQLFAEIGRVCPQFKGRQQQDAHELLRYLLSGIANETDEYNRKTIRDQTLNKLKVMSRDELLLALQTSPNMTADILNTFFDTLLLVYENFTSSVGGALSLLIIGGDSKEERKRRAAVVKGMDETSQRSLVSLLQKIRSGSVVLNNGSVLEATTASALSSSSSSSKFASTVSDLFVGALQNTVTCLTCQQDSVTEEAFFDLSVAIEPPVRSKPPTPIRPMNKAELKVIKKQTRGRRMSAQKKHTKKRKTKGKLATNKTAVTTAADETEDTAEDKDNTAADDEETTTDDAPSTDVSEDPEDDAAEDASALADEVSALTITHTPSTPPLSGLGYDRIRGDCSIEQCLYAYTDPDLLTGSNAYGCSNCSAKANAITHIDDEHKDFTVATSAVSTTSTDSNTSDEKENLEDVDSRRRSPSPSPASSPAPSLSPPRPTPPIRVKRDAIKRSSIKQAPTILTLHLKRFTVVSSRQMGKVQKHVSFATTIDIAPFMTPASSESLLYRLYGIVSHSGSLNGGHYIAYVQRRDVDGDNTDRWYCISDSHVSHVRLDSVLNAQPYILFYQRITTAPSSA